MITLINYGKYSLYIDFLTDTFPFYIDCPVKFDIGHMEETFGKSALSFVDGCYKIDTEMKWVYEDDYVCFKTEDDLIEFKLRFL